MTTAQPIVRMVGLALVALLSLTACGTDSFVAPQQITGEYAPAPADTADSLGVAGEAGEQRAQPGPEVEADVITTGDATVRTADPATAATDFAATVRERGGSIASSETSTRADQPRATVTARVPAADYQAVLDSLADRGEVVSQSTQATDVGRERVDLEARREALQASIDRLTELMSEAGTVEDLLRAEETLTQRQADLDALTGQLDWLADQVALSTLTVTFTVDDDGYRPPNVFARAWAAFVTSLETIVIVVVGLLPWLVILALVAAAVLALVRRRRTGRPRREEEAG